MSTRSAAVRPVTRTVIAADSPYQAGHFPGRPIFPGVFLIELVCDAARDELGADHSDWRLHTLRRARFVAPVFPGDRLDVGLELSVDPAGCEVQAVCRRSGLTVARVAARIAPTGVR